MKRTALTHLKARTGYYVELAKSGETVLVTDRGVPVARLMPLSARDAGGVRESAPWLGRLADRGLIRVGERRVVAEVAEELPPGRALGAAGDLVEERRRR